MRRLRLTGRWRMRRRRRIPVMYALPSLITCGAMACGIIAILNATERGRPGRAVTWILAAALLDLLDGRVARMTHTQSEFGVQLDSLSDAIAFGVAPALVMHGFAVGTLGAAGTAVCCVYAAAAIVRLARFNVAAARDHGPEDGPPRFMVGLAVPASAAIVVGLVGIDVDGIVDLRAPQAAGWLAAVMILLGFLMVSTVPLRSFKDLRRNRATVATLVALLAAFGLVSRIWSPAVALLAVMGIYLAQGFAETARRRLRNQGDGDGGRSASQVHR